MLSAILYLGNIRYKRKTYRDDSIDICNPEVLPVVSELLEVYCEKIMMLGVFISAYSLNVCSDKHKMRGVPV